MLLFIFALPLFVGVSLCGAGAYLLHRSRAFRRSAGRAAGVLTGLDPSDRRSSLLGRSRPVLLPLVRFQTPDGREVETRVVYGAAFTRLSEGAPVVVLYDPTDPSRARLERMSGIGPVIGVLLVLAGLGICASGLFTLIAALCADGMVSQTDRLLGP
jgi:hypothetical protein